MFYFTCDRSFSRSHKCPQRAAGLWRPLLPGHCWPAVPTVTMKNQCTNFKWQKSARQLIKQTRNNNQILSQKGSQLWKKGTCTFIHTVVHKKRATSMFTGNNSCKCGAIFIILSSSHSPMNCWKTYCHIICENWMFILSVQLNSTLFGAKSFIYSRPCLTYVLTPVSYVYTLYFCELNSYIQLSDPMMWRTPNLETCE